MNKHFNDLENFTPKKRRFSITTTETFDINPKTDLPENRRKSISITEEEIFETQEVLKKSLRTKHSGGDPENFQNGVLKRKKKLPAEDFLPRRSSRLAVIDKVSYNENDSKKVKNLMTPKQKIKPVKSSVQEHGIEKGSFRKSPRLSNGLDTKPNSIAETNSYKINRVKNEMKLQQRHAVSSETLDELKLFKKIPKRRASVAEKSNIVGMPKQLPKRQTSYQVKNAITENQNTSVTVSLQEHQNERDSLRRSPRFSNALHTNPNSIHETNSYKNNRVKKETKLQQRPAVSSETLAELELFKKIPKRRASVAQKSNIVEKPKMLAKRQASYQDGMTFSMKPNMNFAGQLLLKSFTDRRKSILKTPASASRHKRVEIDETKNTKKTITPNLV